MIFNRDFYPTPNHVLSRMLAGVNISGKIIFEPSSGKGDIIDYLYQFGAKEVLCCEIEPELAQISASKGNFIGNDFMKVLQEEISHINLIVANPPFSKDEQHIMYMWEIAPEGCEIISLCNWETINNDRYYNRRKLNELIEQYGYKENLGDCFSDAERETKVNIGLVRLFKPITNKDFEFDGYFDLSEEYEHQENGLMSYNEIRDMVNRYKAAVQMFDEVEGMNDKINSIMSPINIGKITFGGFKTGDRNEQTAISRGTFKKELQKSAWKVIFNKMNLDKVVTKSVMADINKFVELQQHVPFTLPNIYKMIELIWGTREARFNRIIIEAFEKICSFSYENSEAGQGWKTNSNYKINKNFIIPWMCECDKRWPTDHVKLNYRRDEYLDDIVKALCFLTGINYDDKNWMYYFFNHNKILWGEWVKWNDFFMVKGYKKGTMHFKFIDDDVWMKFNTEYAKAKGWQLPNFTDTKTTGKERTKKTGVEVYDKI